MKCDKAAGSQLLSTARRYTRLAFGLGVVCVLVTVVVNAVLVPAANLHVLPQWEQRAAVVLQREVGVFRGSYPKRCCSETTRWLARTGVTLDDVVISVPNHSWLRYHHVPLRNRYGSRTLS